jgi:DnaJ-class molecular chaperone
MATKTCPDCKGAGQYDVPYIDGTVTVICRTCNGNGYIPVINGELGAIPQD